MNEIWWAVVNGGCTQNVNGLHTRAQFIKLLLKYIFLFRNTDSRVIVKCWDGLSVSGDFSKRRLITPVRRFINQRKTKIIQFIMNLLLTPDHLNFFYFVIKKTCPFLFTLFLKWPFYFGVPSGNEDDFNLHVEQKMNGCKVPYELNMSVGWTLNERWAQTERSEELKTLNDERMMTER